MAGAGRLDGQVAIVTGASLGIGEATARRLVAEGARVVLAARGAERLEAVAAALRGAGAEAVAVAMDVADDDACRRLVATALARFGRLDVLVNNAGLHHRGEFAALAPEALADMVTVNLRAPVLLTRLAVEPMRAAGRGTVVQVASLAGCVPLPEAAVYSATKFGLRALSLALAEELRGSGVRFSVVSPGPVSTGFILGDLDEVSDLALSQPMRTADDVAHAIVACAVDGAPERQLPAASGALATAAYLVPPLARALRPLLRRRGRRAKDRLRRALSAR